MVLFGMVGGSVAARVWSAGFVDHGIGVGTADTLLGRGPQTTPVGGIAAGVVFALATGLSGSFTACSIAVFGAVGPLVGQKERRRKRFLHTWGRWAGWPPA